MTQVDLNGLGGLSPNEAWLLQIFALSVASFLLLFCPRAVRAARSADGEVALIRAWTRALRILVVVLLLAQVPLLQRAFGSSNWMGHHVLLDGITRPVGMITLGSTGLFASHHAALRAVFCATMLCSVGVDTRSEVTLDAERQCRRSPSANDSGRCSQELADLSDARLSALLVRDTLSITFAIWALLLGAQMCIAIGCGRHRRYAPQQLSTSRSYGKEKLPQWLLSGTR